MTSPLHTFEATPENFARLVLENSAKGPVLVNYWSPAAGPCRVLMPRLVRLASEYAGRFLLVTINTDEHVRLVREHGVNSVPTVKCFRHGKVVDTIHGAQPDAEFRSLIERHVARASDATHFEAIREYHAGNVERALSLLAQAAMADPQNLRIPADLAKLLILENKFIQAQELLDALPAAAKAEPQIAVLHAHLGFLRTAADAPPQELLEKEILANPQNVEARYQLSALKLVRDDFTGAMDELIEILRCDRDYRDGAARKGLLAIFQLLGNESDLVTRYRGLALDALD